MPGTEKSAHQACKDAVMRELIAVECTADIPVDLYLVGPTLVSEGFTEQQIASALDSLVYEKRIKYAGGNRVQLT